MPFGNFFCMLFYRRCDISASQLLNNSYRLYNRSVRYRERPRIKIVVVKPRRRTIIRIVDCRALGHALDRHLARIRPERIALARHNNRRLHLKQPVRIENKLTSNYSISIHLYAALRFREPAEKYGINSDSKQSLRKASIAAVELHKQWKEQNKEDTKKIALEESAKHKKEEKLEEETQVEDAKAQKPSKRTYRHHNRHHRALIKH